MTIDNAWQVLLLFLIPIGGGIPGGVLLAKAKNIPWPFMSLLYFISDIILACVFEPIMLGVVAVGKKSPFVARVRHAFREATQKTIGRYGSKPSPLTLILISFGVDPMSGRVATAAAGHGFIVGWLLAITGDMFYFGVIMICTLWLSDTLGDGTIATIVIVLLMVLIPKLFSYRIPWLR